MTEIPSYLVTEPINTFVQVEYAYSVCNKDVSKRTYYITIMDALIGIYGLILVSRSLGLTKLQNNKFAIEFSLEYITDADGF